ncbi:MAG: hypothetical protein AUJ33_02045 [Parcubacteria group bacterium CG1_02_40_25]|nr:MAG: hypothetical protein AUJ33_02045 [Parcubacteria group bacterium CG1_02_40_25]
MNQFSKHVQKSYDLEERTAKFAERLMGLVKDVEHNDVNYIISKQLLRSGISMGANYCEANAASLGRDFRNKIYLCKKETNETKFHLRMIAKDSPALEDQLRVLWQEAHELPLIFQKIATTIDAKKQKSSVGD